MLKKWKCVVLTGSFSSFRPSFSTFLFILLMKSPITSIGFYFNLMIKTIGLHRYLVKYIYSTLSHVLAFYFILFFFKSFFLAVSPISIQLSLSPGKRVQQCQFYNLYIKTGQNSSARRHLVISKPYVFFFFLQFFFLKEACKIYPEKSVVNNQQQ